MEWVEPELIRVFCPAFADVFVRRQSPQGLKSPREVISGQEGFEVLAELIVAFIVVAADGRFLEGPVHSLDLTVCPRMIWLCKPVLDPVLAAAHIKHVDHVSRSWAVCISGREGKLNSVVREHGVDLIGNGCDQLEQEARRGHSVGLLHQLGKDEFAWAINGHEEVKLAFFGSHLGDVDVKEADWIGLKLLFWLLIAFNFREPADVTALKQPVQGGSRQLRDCGLQGEKTIVQRQQSMLSKRDSHGLLFARQYRRARSLRSHGCIMDEGALLPLGNRLWIEIVLRR